MKGRRILPPGVTSVIVFAGQSASSLLWLATISILTYKLGPLELSAVLYLLAASAALETASDLGLRFGAISTFSQADDNKRGVVLMATFLGKLVFSILTLLFAVGLGWFGLLKFSDGTQLLLTWLIAITLPSASPFVWWLRSQGLQWYEVSCLVVYRLSLLILFFFVASESATTNEILGIFLLGNLGLLLLSALPLLLSIRETPARIGYPSSLVFKRLIKSSVPLGASLVLSQLSTRYWVLLLGYFSIVSGLSAFATAQMLIQTTLLIGVAIGSAYLPRLASLFVEDKQAFRSISKDILVISFGFGIAVTLVMIMAGSTILEIVFNQDRHESKLVIEYLAYLPPVILLAFVSRFLFSASQNGHIELRCALIGFVPAALVAPLALEMTGLVGLLTIYVIAESVVTLAKGLVLQNRSVIALPRIENAAVGATIVCAFIYIAQVGSGFMVTSSDWVHVAAGLLTSLTFLVTYFWPNRRSLYEYFSR